MRTVLALALSAPLLLACDSGPCWDALYGGSCREDVDELPPWDANTGGGWSFAPGSGTVEQFVSTGTFNKLDVMCFHSCGTEADPDTGAGTGGGQCWGYDSDGQVSGLPMVLNGMQDEPDEVVAGEFFTCVLDASGTTVCFGAEDGGVTEAPDLPLTDIDAGQFHACGLDEGGELHCWGGSTENRLDVPSGSYKQVSVGLDHACALREDGAVRCWGSASSGQLDAPSGTDFVQVSAGFTHSCALSGSGRLECWGVGEWPSESREYTQMSAGYGNTCAVDIYGAVHCSSGLGGEDVSSEPVDEIQVGAFYACGLQSDRRARCWGANDYGQIAAP